MVKFGQSLQVKQVYIYGKSKKRNRQTILASRDRLKVNIVLAIHSLILAVRK